MQHPLRNFTISRLSVLLLILLLSTTSLLLLLGEARGAPSSTRNLGSSLASYAGEQDSEHSGWSVAALGDVNGDGLGDVIIGAPDYDDPLFGLAAGRAYLIFGKTSGWNTNLNVTKADVIITGVKDLAEAGYKVAGAGDVNHDGLNDILIAAPFSNDAGYQAGKVYLFLGRRSWAPLYTVDQANASFKGEAGTDRAGYAAAAAGDVNGDGYGDFLIGAPGNDEIAVDAGKAYLILGKATGWATNVSLSTADASFRGVGAYDTHPYGFEPAMAVASAGDVNGDGLDDILIGDPGVHVGSEYDHGAAYLILGHTVGWMRGLSLSRADVTYIGSAQADRLGWAVAGVGDVNVDGYDDFVLGAPWNSTSGDRAGTTYLFLGKAGGWSKQGSLASASATFLGVSPTDHSGFSLSGGHDVNGDGLDDILISAHTAGTNSLDPEGMAYIEFGRRVGWRVGDSLANANISYIGEGKGDWAGYSLSMGPDVNGDGNDDFIIGAPFNTYGGGMLENGKAYIVVPQSNIKPYAPTGLTIYQAGSRTPASRAELGQGLTVEVVAPDKDANKADNLHLRLSSSKRDPNGVDLRLVETGLATGVFRGAATAMDMSHPGHGWIGAAPGETLTFVPKDSSTISTSIPVTFTNSQNLSSFPQPFVQGGLVNATLVVASSQPHYPANAANTIDAVGAVTVAMRLGRRSSQGELGAALDTDLASSSDGLTIDLAGGDNLITFGSEGGNLVTRAVNRTEPIVLSKGTIRVIPTGTQYRRSSGPSGTLVDYACISLAYDQPRQRYVLTVAGLSGFATRAASQLLADGSLPLDGQGVVVGLYDDTGDGVYDRSNVVEVVWSERSLRGSSSYVFRGNVQPLVTTATSLPPSLVGGGTLSATVVVAYSLPHTPVGAANTIDVVGSLTFGFKLGRSTTSGKYSALLDIDAAHWDSTTSTILVTAPGNLVAFGGRGNDLISKYYNSTLPVRLETSKGVYVAGTNHSYVRTLSGNVSYDYAFYARTYDGQRGGWAFIVAGLSGFATRAIGQILGGRILPMDSGGGVLGLVDLDGNGVFEQYNNVETAGGPATLADYPYPFRNLGILNVSVVIGLSQPHPPANAANTIDAVGGVVVAMALGRGSSGGRLDALLDTEVATSYDGKTLVLTKGGNLIALGGQGSNYISRYYNQMTSVGPVLYLNKTYIEIFGTRDLYRKVISPTGAVTDYGYVALINDQALGREVVIVAGLSGFATKAMAQLFAEGALTLKGTGLVVRLNDTNGDGSYESYDVVEGSGPLYTGHAYVTTATSSPPLATCSSGVDLSTFPCPFVSKGVLDATLVLGYSLPHNGVNGASTIDVLGGILVGATLGRASTSGSYRAKLDIDVISSDGTYVATVGNVLSFGGRGGNVATKAINPTLPVRLALNTSKGDLSTDGNGRGIYSTLSGKNYVRVVYPNGSFDDYAMISWAYDAPRSRYQGELLGLSGFSTRAIAKLLALAPPGLLSGTGVVVKLRDLNGDNTFESYQTVDGAGAVVPMVNPAPFP